MSVTRGDILDALRAAMAGTPPEGDGFTTVELAESLQVHPNRVRQLLRALIIQGNAEPIRLWRTDITNRTRRIDGYRLIGRKKKK